MGFWVTGVTGFVGVHCGRALAERCGYMAKYPWKQATGRHMAKVAEYQKTPMKVALPVREGAAK